MKANFKIIDTLTLSGISILMLVLMTPVISGCSLKKKHDPDNGKVGFTGKDFQDSLQVDYNDIDLNITSIDIDQFQGLGIWETGIKSQDLSLDVQDITVDASIPFGVPTLPVYPGGEFNVPVDGVLNMDPISHSATVIAFAPDGISNITDIALTSTSNIVVELSLGNSLLSSGSFIPDFTIDMGNIFTFTDGNVISINSDYTLSESNGYKASRQYEVKSVNLLPENWQSNVQIPLSDLISIAGHATLQNPKTTKDRIQNYNGELPLTIAIKCDGVKIESFKMDIEDIRKEANLDIPIEINDITLPEGFESIEEVVFSDASSLDFSATTDNLNTSGLDVMLKTLRITLPQDIEAEGAENGVLEYSDIDLSSGLSNECHFKKLTLPAPSDGHLSYKGSVKIQAITNTRGNVLNTALPKTETDDAKLSISVSSDINVADYRAKVSGIPMIIKTAPISFHYSLDNSLVESGASFVCPEGNPAIILKMILPQTLLGLKAGSDGIRIVFPEFIHFKNIQSGILYDEVSNTVTIKDAIPESIILPIAEIAISPTFDEAAGEYRVSGEINISGSIVTGAGTITRADIKAIADSNINIEVSMDSF